MEERLNSQRKFAYCAVALLIAYAIYWLFSRACFQSEADGQLCVSWFDPLLYYLRYPASRLGDHPKWWYNTLLPWFCGFVGLLSLVSLVRGKIRPAIFWLLALVPLLGEWASLLGEGTYALVFYTSGVALLALFWFFSRQIDDYEDSSPPRQYVELVFFGLLIAALATVRFYALNRLPFGWDAELCVFRLYSGSFDRLWQHESGWTPQTSTGLSWLLINRFLGHFDEPNIYFLYHRTLGAFISILKVTLLFLFLRNYFGRFAAFFGAALLAFGPPEDWWSRVPNYHHWPGLVTLVVVWATINAMQKKTWQSFILLSLLSVTTRWVYPSAMFMVAVPIAFFGSLLIFQWSQWKPHLAKISVLLVGVAIWCEWLSICRALYLGRWEWLPPVIIPSHSEIAGGIFDKLYHIFIVNGADLFSNLFFRQISSTHWTVALTPKPWKVVPSFEGVLVLWAVARMIGERRDKISWLLLIALFFGALPGITSSVADRRIGAMFVLLIIIASREAAWVARFMERSIGRYAANSLRALTPLLLGAYLATLSCSVFFFMTKGVPRQQALGKILQENVKDNYLLVDLTGQLPCDLFLAVQRELKARNCKASFVSSKWGGEFSPLNLIENPRFDQKEWWYTEKGVTELEACTDWATRKWEGVTYVITNSNEADQWVEKLRQRYPNGQLQTLKVSYIPYDEERVLVFTTPLP